jgi:pyruvate/2-oxoglutarate dehydrogenase complex dihydrolipoamide acyltransferase (E2) component
VIVPTREEYEAVLAAEAEADGNPFLGYIGHGGGATVQSAAVSEARPPAQAVASNEAPLISPRARRLLVQSGLSLEHAREIVGSGPGGRIVDGDVAAWIEAHGDEEPERSRSGDARVASRIPLRGRRGTIAERMMSSLQTAAQLTSVLEIDVEPLVQLRRRLNDAGAAPRIGVTSIVAKLAAAALREHPILNARVVDDAIELFADVNIAIAVDTPDGVVAPVVHGADRLSLEEVNVRIGDLAERTRSGTLSPDDLAEGTFTLSNGGVLPVDITTAILNPPQTALLWIGRIRERPVVVDGAIVVRSVLQACLTYDHRAVDGGPAAAFLGAFAALVAGLPELPS